MENHVYSTGMVFHIQPVTYVFPLAIYRQRLPMTDIIDKQRNQLLRELIGSVVVRAVCHNGRHAVSVVEGTYKVVTACLRCRIRTVRIVLRCFPEELLAIRQMVLARRSLCRKRRLYALRMRHLQRSIHLVRRDMVEPLALILLRQALPIQLGSLKQAQRTHHIGTSKGKRVFDRTVHMALRSQVDDTIHLFLLHQPIESIEIADIHLHERIVRLILHILQIGQITRIRQLVQIDNAIFRILVYKQAHHMAAYKTGTAGNYDIAFEIHLNND